MCHINSIFSHLILNHSRCSSWSWRYVHSIKNKNFLTIFKGTQRLPRLILPSHAKELIFTARKISASEALHLNIIDHLVEETAQQKALEIARQIIVNAPLSVRYAKSAIQNGMSVSSMKDALLVERENYAKIIPTSDRLEGMAAFREKRKPVYRGY